jgi:hypothetical protein
MNGALYRKLAEVLPDTEAAALARADATVDVGEAGPKGTAEQRAAYAYRYIHPGDPHWTERAFLAGWRMALAWLPSQRLADWPVSVYHGLMANGEIRALMGEAGGEPTGPDPNVIDLDERRRQRAGEPLLRCTVCGRESVVTRSNQLGGTCLLRLPGGSFCPGVFQRIPPPVAEYLTAADDLVCDTCDRRVTGNLVAGAVCMAQQPDNTYCPGRLFPIA